jgi:hypothetical protein
MVKARLGQALASTALAGGREIYSPTRDADIQMFFNANFPPGFLGTTVSGPQILVYPNNEKLTLTASAKIDTTFMKGLGFNELNVSTTTELTRETTYLDVILAIDISGVTVSTAVPPFTNPLTGVVQSLVHFPNNLPVPLLTPPPDDWKGCVFSRFLNNGVSDDAADIVFAGQSSASGNWMPGNGPALPVSRARPVSAS